MIPLIRSIVCGLELIDRRPIDLGISPRLVVESLVWIVTKFIGLLNVYVFYLLNVILILMLYRCVVNNMVQD